MKPVKEIYDRIPPVPESGFFQHFPGIYCQNCGRDFALYSYSALSPDGLDEEGKPFYNLCGIDGCGANNDHQPSALRSLGAGALIGLGLLALVALLSGCTQAKAPAVALPALPERPPVILAVESQRSERPVSMTALATSMTLTASASQPVALNATTTPQKRGSLTFGWSRIAGAVGYRLYYGTNSLEHYASAVVGNVTNATLTGLDEGTRYFVVATSMDALGGESGFSNEILAVTPIYVGLSPYIWSVSSYGVVGKTNLLLMTTNLVDWRPILTWLGTGQLTNALHTNTAKAFFRVEAL